MNTVVLSVSEFIIKGTPVDTGQARSNWLPSHRIPMSGTIEPYAPGRHLGISESANADGAMNRVRGAVAARPLGETFYLSNNVEYIEDLNQGTSKQAPTMFVQLAIQQGLNKAKKANPDKIAAEIL